MVSDEMVEAFGQAFWTVNAASKIDAERDAILRGLEAALSAQDTGAIAVTDEMVERACRAFSESRINYPGEEAKTPITEWFEIDAQDAVDFGVLKVPQWDKNSDIRAMQFEWYVSVVVKEAMRAALKAALEPQERDGWKLVPVEPTEEMKHADAGTCTGHVPTWNAALYRAMIAAAPPHTEGK